MTEEYKQSIEEVEAGNTVAYRHPSYDPVEWTYEKVERVTAKQIVLEGGMRFWKRNGNPVGAGDGMRDTSGIFATTPKIAVCIMRNQERRLSLARLNVIKSMTIDEMNAIPREQVNGIVNALHTLRAKGDTP